VQRPSLDAPWGTPQNLGSRINSAQTDQCPHLSSDGYTFIFASNRAGGIGANDLYIARRRNPRDDFGWDVPENLGSTINTTVNELTPATFEDENGNVTLYFSSNRPGGLGGADIYASVLRNDGTFGPPSLVPELSSSSDDLFPTPRRDGLELLFSSDRPGSIVNPATGMPSTDLWVSTRASISEPWGPPVNLGPTVNTPLTEAGPALSFSATSLVFFSNLPGGLGSQDLWEIKRTRFPIPTAECAVTGTPAVSGVVNSGSFQAVVAPNSIVSIFGSGFAPQGTGRGVRLGPNDTRFPTELGCVAVEVAGIRAPVTFVSPTQINAQLPSLTITGPVEVRVILNPGRSNEIRGEGRSVTIAERAPAFFTFAGSSIAAQHSDFTPLADPAVVAAGRPARPGDTIVLYGTGFGLTVPAFQTGEIADRTALLRDPVTVNIGGVFVRSEDILYAGISPGSISGLYQFNVRVPATVPQGNLPVVIVVGGARTQTGVSIPVR
jgi:uncharacterized protein (TIGR03437 family)